MLARLKAFRGRRKGGSGRSNRDSGTLLAKESYEGASVDWQLNMARKSNPLTRELVRSTQPTHRGADGTNYAELAMYVVQMHESEVIQQLGPRTRL
ncbi:hypothetical protein VTI74DRAFT_679 [Chaetomium olivicolor]